MGDKSYGDDFEKSTEEVSAISDISDILHTSEKATDKVREELKHKWHVHLVCNKCGINYPNEIEKGFKDEFKYNYTLMLKPHGDKSPKSAGEKSASEKYALQTLLGWGEGYDGQKASLMENLAKRPWPFWPFLY